jgi:hypothetical protein
VIFWREPQAHSVRARQRSRLEPKKILISSRDLAAISRLYSSPPSGRLTMGNDGQQGQLYPSGATMNRSFTAALLRRALVISVLSVPMFASASVTARADSLTADDILSQFNAVVGKNFSTNSDVEGRLVAGNIRNTTSSTFL